MLMATAQKPLVQKITDPVQIIRLESAATKGDMGKFAEIALESRSIDVVKKALDISADMREFDVFKKIALGQQGLRGTIGHAMRVSLEMKKDDAAREICAGIDGKELAEFAVKMFVEAHWREEYAVMSSDTYKFGEAKVSGLDEYAAELQNAKEDANPRMKRDRRRRHHS